jgi:hypothetical protein
VPDGTACARASSPLSCGPLKAIATLDRDATIVVVREQGDRDNLLAVWCSPAFSPPGHHRIPAVGILAAPMAPMPKSLISRSVRRVPPAFALAVTLAAALVVALVGSVLAIGASAATASITFVPVADAYVQASSPSTNKGADRKLKAEGAPLVRSYVRFTVAGVPSGARISAVRLRLYAKSTSAVGIGVQGGVTDTTWGESTVAWSNAPAFTSTPLTSSGAIVSNRWIELVVTPAVAGNGPITFVLTTTDPASLQFASREERAAIRPQLVVDYTTDDPPPPPPGTDPILVGAGDIADTPSGRSGADEATALLLDGLVTANPGRVTVFVAGDNAYENGSATDYASYYDPTWGRHKAITKPVPGNHEYQTAGAAGYYGYFGAAAGDPAKGYYAYDLGAWRIYALNSELVHGAGSTQEQWLRADLAAHTGTTCVAAYWHRPRFSSGDHGSDSSFSAFWQALYDYNAELVLVGHDHNYQRFAPQTAGGARDDARGLREFVVGTGGRSFYAFPTPITNTEAWNTSTHGVLKLTLHATSYDFQFVPIAGQTYTDSGTGVACH